MPSPTTWAAVERGRVLPPLPEDGLHVVHGGSGDLGLHVVPGRGGAVLVGQVVGLGVTEVVGVVAAGVAQVDAADERDVARRVVAVPEHDELLVVRPSLADPHVAPGLDPAGSQQRAELLVVAQLAGRCGGSGVPHESAYVDPAGGGPAQHLQHLAARLAGQPLVGIALPVGEDDHVAGSGGLDALVELGEVGRAMDERPHPVALGPRPTGVGVVQPGLRVAALGGGQQPREGVVAVMHLHTMPYARARSAAVTGPGVEDLAVHVDEAPLEGRR